MDIFSNDEGPISYTGNASGKGAVSLRIDPDPDSGEKIGDPVFVDITINTSVAGSGTAAATTSLGGSGIYGTRIGNKINASLNFNVDLSGSQPASASASADVSIELTSPPFTPNAGGPYAIGEGQSLTLDASKTSNPDKIPLTYTWDVLVNGTWKDGVATGQTATLDPTRLKNLGITASGGPYQVRVEATGDGATVVSEPTKLSLAPGSVTPTSLTWDVKNGGVISSYTDNGSLAQAPKISYYWSKDTNPQDGELILGPIEGATQQGPHAYHLDPKYLTPPAGTHDLLMVVQYGQTSSVKSLAYNPTVVSIKDKYDADENATTLGRFFSGVNVPNEDFTVQVSDDLAALRPNKVTMQYGDNGLTLQRVSSDPNEYTTGNIPNFDPQTAGSIPLVVSFSKGGSTFFTNQKTTLDVVKPPTWLKALDPSNLTFDETSEAYELNGTLLYLSADQIAGFVIPDGVKNWLGNNTQNGLTIHVVVNVNAPLGTEKPNVNALVSGDLTFLGNEVSLDKLPEINIDVDSRTLALNGASITIPFSGSTNSKFSWGTPLKAGLFTIKSQLSADLGYEGKFTLALNSDGSLNYRKSQLELTLSADNFSGGMDIGLLPASVQEVLPFFENILKAPPNILYSLLSSLGIVPQLDVNAALTGSMYLDGTFQLVPGGGVRLIPWPYGGGGGGVDLTPSVTADIKWLGQTFPIAQFDFLANYLAIDQSF